MGSTFCYWNLHHYTEFTVRLDGNTDGRRINMLKELRIQNFKGWKDTGTIRLAPIFSVPIVLANPASDSF